MTKAFPELPGWSFHVEEVSAGVYEATGNDGTCHRVACKGTDPDALLKECREAAKKLARGTN
ncbi:MAG: hypothetical protein M3O36_19230 [Myxococcota bacterium]|nr:hypothetical protein [Myxococcota bacterium]